jgi:hypothetical protein
MLSIEGGTNTERKTIREQKHHAEGKAGKVSLISESTWVIMSSNRVWGE